MPPLRKRRRTPKCPGLSAREITRISLREQLMKEIRFMRLLPNGPTPPVKRAATLLNRYWIEANGQSRDEILKAASWLVRVAKMQSSMALQQALSNSKKRSVGMSKVHVKSTKLKRSTRS